jgi:hypothetical protein
MKKNLISVAVMFAILTITGTAKASEVYIEQAGSNTTIDITQTGTGNRVGSQGTPSTFGGDSLNIDIIQNGSGNQADIQLVTATSTVINYSATGDTNILDVSVNGGTGNSLTAVIDGDSNRLTMCATNDGAGTPAGATAACSTGISVNNTINVVNITGNSNTVNLELASADATNTINIGQNTPSNNNVVNLTQTGLDNHTVNLAIDGNTNKVNILQQ